MDTREHIKEVARTLFAKHGYEGVSIRDIIEKANVNLGSITYHFGGKEELYQELILDMAKRLREEIVKIDSMKASATHKLEVFIQAYMNALLHNPVHARMIIMQMSMGDKRFMKIIKPYVHANFGTLVKILDEGMRKKEFRKMNVQLAVFSLFSICAHYITVQPVVLSVMGKSKYEDDFIEQAIEHTVQFVLSALKNTEGKG